MKGLIRLSVLPAVFFLFFVTVMFLATPVHSFVVPDTGITKCYDATGNEIVCPGAGEPLYGQDAQYGPGRVSFQVNGDGTVSDPNTGLMYELKGNADGVSNQDNPNDADNTYTWTEAQGAITQLNSMRYAGHADWRLPTSKELSFIMDLSKNAPGPTADLSVFPATRPGRYWTSRVFAGDATKAWVEDFQTGEDAYIDKTTRCYFRAVRGGGQ